MKRILLSLVLIAGTAGALVYGATGAFFSDTETSTANTFTAGDIDLKIDNESYYNGVFNEGTSWEESDLTTQKFFDFLDLKPDDYGEDTISVHVNTNDAWLCANVTLTSNDDNGINEPESEVDQTDGAGNGELADLVNFLWWADDGDNVLEDGEPVISQGPIGDLPLNTPFPVTLADSDDNIWGDDGPIPGDETVYIGKAWCFGDIDSAALPQDDYSGPDADNNANTTAGEPEDGGISCSGELIGNGSQTDSLTADISFEAIQARHNDDFQCNEPEEEIVECEVPGIEFANTSGLFDQGRTKVGGMIPANRSLPSAAFGAPQTFGSPSDVGFPAGSFVSLGFGVGTTSSRSLVLDFSDNVVVDDAGNDLKIYEVTGGVYPDEHIKVEGSQDGISWTLLAADVIRDAEIDINGAMAWARYIRITDINNPAAFSDSVADGYDLDAIEALNCGVQGGGGPGPQ